MSNVFVLVYWLGMFAEIIIRFPYRKTWKEGVKKEQRVSALEYTLLTLLSVFMFFLPVFYSVTDRLDFADYTLPVGISLLGMLVFITGLFVFWRSHNDLKSNWSPSLEIRQDHTLVTTGIYRYVRHPMYASQWLMVIAQVTLLQNWIAGPLNLLFYVFFFYFRVRSEEKMMLDAFGDRYKEYMQQVGSVIPKLQIKNKMCANRRKGSGQ